MALANGVRFIWLDVFIGKEQECLGLKRMFRTALEPTIAMPPDQIDALIYALHEQAAPFLFADTTEKAIELVKIHKNKKILFISSGSLGVQIIPDIISIYPCVHAFYIFCAIPDNYVDFVIEHRSHVQGFTNEIDLLVRLTRDISEDIIKQGKEYLNLNFYTDALKSFKSARTLNVTANTIDRLNLPFLEHLRVLDGYQNEIGLIQIAINMLNQQQLPPPSQLTDNNEPEEHLSQQESQR